MKYMSEIKICIKTLVGSPLKEYIFSFFVIDLNIRINEGIFKKRMKYFRLAV